MERCLSQDLILMCIKTYWMKWGFVLEDFEVILTSRQVAIIWIYVKRLSCKNIILENIKWRKKWLKIHANSLSDALVLSRKKIACGAGPPAALRGFGIYNPSAQCLPDFCQKACGPCQRRQTKDAAVQNFSRSQTHGSEQGVARFWATVQHHACCPCTLVDDQR